MYIEYVKLIAHIPYKEDIELFFDKTDDTIMIKGRTGSGKSFLVSALQPLSSSSRYVKTYSIYPGKRGYKEIIYVLDDNVTRVKVRHEYSPNNKGTHSCKSYLSVCEFGDWKELNESGHNVNFEELVKKYLKYDRKTSEFSSLNVKSSGFIQSTSDNRNKTLFSLVESDTVKSFKDSINKKVSDNNSRLKLFKESLDSIVLKRNIEEDKNTIINFKRTIKDEEITISKLTKELHEKINNLAVFKTESSTFDIHELKRYSEYLLSVKQYCDNNNLKSVGEFISHISTIDNKIESLLLDLNKEKNKLSEVNDKINKANRINELAKKINIIKDDLSEINKKLSEKFIITNIDKEISNVSFYLKSIQSNREILESLELYNIKSLDDLRLYRQQLSSSRENLKEQKLSYDKCSEFKKLIKSKEDTVCPNCGHYNPILKEIYDAINTTDDISKINNDIENLNVIINKIDSSILNIKDSINKVNDSNLLTDNFKKELGIHSIEDFIKSIYVNNIDDISYIFNTTKDYGINQVSSLNKTLISYEAQYDAITTSESFNIPSLEANKNSLELSIKTIKNKIEELSNSVIPKPSINLNNITNYNIEDVIELYRSSKGIEDTINNFENEIQELKNKIEDTTFSIEQKKERINVLNKIIDDYNSYNDYVKMYSNEKKNLDMVKTILLQDIPTLLLDDNIKYIEESVNKILTACDINMAISLCLNENKTGIEIPVYVGNKTIPDASALSSGETSLISTLINTCLLSLLGYKILIVDELDAYLDTNFRCVYERILTSICTVLDINQIFCISHNINLDSASKLITVGDTEGLDIDTSNKKIINIR